MSFLYVTEDGAAIYKKGGRFVIGRNNERIAEVPEELLEGLVLFGAVQVSASVAAEMLEKGIPVTWLSHSGKFFGRLESTRHVNVFRQQKQILLQGTPFALSLAKRIIEAKAHNQITVLRRYNKNACIQEVDMRIRSMVVMHSKIDASETLPELMGHEGAIAKLYFSGLGYLAPKEFSFTRRSKQPPRDAFNSLLSFGYTILMYEVYTAIANEGLHPYFGFLHSLHQHHPALASDLIEEWRAVLIDSMVMNILHRRILNESHFQRGGDDDNGVYLTAEGRKIFLERYSKKMTTAAAYMNGKMTYRQALTKQAASFAQAIMMENPEAYEPIRLR